MRGIGGRRRRDALPGLDRLDEHARQRSGRPLLLLEKLGDVARDAAEYACDREAEQRRDDDQRGYSQQDPAPSGHVLRYRQKPPRDEPGTSVQSMRRKRSIPGRRLWDWPLSHFTRTCSLSE